MLATLAFLFGLLMGQWMWGQFKQRLQKTGQELLDTEAENATLKSELKEWRGKKNQTVEDKRKEDEKHANELKAARDLAGDEKSKVQIANRKLTDKEKEISRLSAELEALQKQAEEDGEAVTVTKESEEIPEQEAGPKAQASLHATSEEELQKLRDELSDEKRTKASLREVIAGLKSAQANLQKEIAALETANEKLQKELAEAHKTD